MNNALFLKTVIEWPKPIDHATQQPMHPMSVSHHTVHKIALWYPQEIKFVHQLSNKEQHACTTVLRSIGILARLAVYQSKQHCCRFHVPLWQHPLCNLHGLKFVWQVSWSLDENKFMHSSSKVAVICLAIRDISQPLWRLHRKAVASSGTLWCNRRRHRWHCMCYFQQRQGSEMATLSNSSHYPCLSGNQHCNPQGHGG